MQGFDVPTLKVPGGTDYVLNNPNDNGNATVLYRDLNSERFDRADPGGPESRRRTLITLGQVTDTIAIDSTEEHAIDNSVNIGGIEPWPWQNDVPDGREYDVQALMVELDNSAGGQISLDSIKLRTEEQDFLENSQQFVDADNFQYPSDDLTDYPWLFWNPATGDTDPLTFVSGEDLQVEYRATNGDTAATQDAVVNAAIIARERRV
jgi:hypothetical protein